MVYRGRIKNGVVVLEGPEAPPEGAEVVVRIVESPVAATPASPRRGLSRIIGVIKDAPRDWSSTVGHLHLQGPETADVPEEKTSRKGRFASIIGKIKNAPPDWSRNHDHYLYGTPKED